MGTSTSAMLTKEQKKQIRKGFAIGFSDKLIARSLGDVNHMQVYNYRHKFGIDRKNIINARYDVWTNLVYKGVSIAQIAAIYEVTERSIKVQLWSKRNISLMDAKAVVQIRLDDKITSGKPNGIPNFLKYEIK